MSPLIGLGLFLIVWLCFWLPLALVVAWKAGMTWSYPISPDHKIPLLLPLYGVAPLVVWGYSHFWSGDTWSDYGLVWNRSLGFPLVAGLAVGMVGVFLLVAVELGLGWRQFNFTKGTASSLRNLGLLTSGLLALTLLIGGIEELVFRGVLVQGLLAALPLWAVVGMASFIFAVSHLMWDGPAGAPSLPGLALMGAVLMLARWVNGGLLGLPWGLHTGWIFAIALIDTLNLAPSINPAPQLLAGQPDQPLTGLPALGLLTLTGLGLGVYAWGL